MLIEFNDLELSGGNRMQKEYIQLFWEHELDNEPKVILYEVNLENERLALRSIDIFANRITSNIDDLYKDVIEIVPIPTVEEFNSHIWGKEFFARLITEKEFEEVWDTHSYHGELIKI